MPTVHRTTEQRPLQQRASPKDPHTGAPFPWPITQNRMKGALKSDLFGQTLEGHHEQLHDGVGSRKSRADRERMLAGLCRNSANDPVRTGPGQDSTRDGNDLACAGSQDIRFPHVFS